MSYFESQLSAQLEAAKEATINYSLAARVTAAFDARKKNFDDASELKRLLEENPAVERILTLKTRMAL